MVSPPIDARTAEGIVAETKELVQTLTQSEGVQGWAAGGNPDAGMALIKIFGRFAETVIGRLNQVPEKNFLAFLNLIGVDVTPPQSARVPVTFQLVQSRRDSLIEALVPAGSRVAAPASQDNPQEAVFETEQPLALTFATLTKRIVSLPAQDQYEEQTGDGFYPFMAGKEATLLSHKFYIAADALQTMPDNTTVMLKLITAGGQPGGDSTAVPPNSAAYLASLPVQWSYYDQNQNKWLALSDVQSTGQGDTWQVFLNNVPRLTNSSVNNLPGVWLQAQLQIPLPAASQGILPQAISINGKLQILPVYPFTDQPDIVRFCYLSIPEAFQHPGVMVGLDVTLKTVGQGVSGNQPQLAWTFKEADGSWAVFSSATFDDGTAGFTQNGRIWLQVPADGSWQKTTYYGQDGYWLRLQLIVGSYSQMPQIETITASTCWPAALQQVQISLPGSRPALLPRQGFFNNQPLDLSKDFYPFGQQPAFNDTFYLAYDPIIEQGAQAGDTITLAVTLRQPGQNNGSPTDPTSTTINLTYEYWDGASWQPLYLDDKTASFTQGDSSTAQPITFTLPAAVATSIVNNQSGYWLRVRLTGGGYGHNAYYEARAAYQITDGKATITKDTDAPDSVPIYQLIPANFKPPIIEKLQFSINDADGNTPTSRPVSLSACLAYNNFIYTNCTDEANKAGATFYPFVANSDQSPALYLGFDRPFEQRTISLFARVEPPPPADVAAEKIKALFNPQPPKVVWEYRGKSGWKPLDVQDDTQLFNQSGLLQFLGPADFGQQSYFGYTGLYWLRVRWDSGYFVAQPRLRGLLTNTTWASQVTTSRNEALGGSNGQASQTFRAAQTPILPGLELQVREPALPSLAEQAQIEAAEGSDAIRILRNNAGQISDIWIRWHRVPDFYGSGPRDRHYSVDWSQGQIRFGDGRNGLIPPAGTNNIRLVRYQTGGGGQGNRPANAITQLKSSLPYVQSVTNDEPAVGGTDQEPLDNVKRFGPRLLRHRGRAVAADDVEDLAYAASPAVARARAIMPQFNPDDLWLDDGQPAGAVHEQANKTAGTIGLVIVPDSTSPQPIPSLALLAQVKSYLLARCGTTAQLWVSGPDWCPVSATATVIPASLAVADVLASRVQAALAQFLHPLTGGANGEGWNFGDVPHESDFYAVISKVSGVHHIKPLSLQISGLPASEARLSLSTLIYSGQHDITLAS